MRIRVHTYDVYDDNGSFVGTISRCRSGWKAIDVGATEYRVRATRARAVADLAPKAPPQPAAQVVR